MSRPIEEDVRSITQGVVRLCGQVIESATLPPEGGSSLYRVGLVGLAPAWRVDGGKIVSLTA